MKRTLIALMLFAAMVAAQDVTSAVAKPPFQKAEVTKAHDAKTAHVIPAEFQTKYWKIVAEQLASQVQLTARIEKAKADHEAEVDRVGKEFQKLSAEATAKAGCPVVSTKDGLACQPEKK